jgi:hypothetical protein
LALRPRRRQRVRGRLEAPERGVVAAGVEPVTNGGGSGEVQCNRGRSPFFPREFIRPFAFWWSEGVALYPPRARGFFFWDVTIYRPSTQLAPQTKKRACLPQAPPAQALCLRHAAGARGPGWCSPGSRPHRCIGLARRKAIKAH